MSELEQLSIAKLNKLFCGLHALIHTAEAALSCLIEFEKGAFESTSSIHDPTFRKTSECGNNCVN